MVNLSIKEQLIILQERLNSVFQMTKLLKEYYRLSEKLSDTEYGLYFEVMYSYIARYIVLEFYRLCDNDNDCVSIPKLKKEVFENFESVFPAKQKDIYGMKYCNITKDELRKNCKTIFNKKIKELQLKVKDIRDHSGLAHGQPEVFDKMISIDELTMLQEAYAEFLNMVDERLNNSNFAFGHGLIKNKGLMELVVELTAKSNE